MGYRIFLAGATGVIGKRLTPMLVESGHIVAGTTRSESRRTLLKAMGAEPLVIDVYHSNALKQAMRAFKPDIIVNQLSDFPKVWDPGKNQQVAERNARIRFEGTANLVHAAIAVGASRFVGQSTAGVYEPGVTPFTESSPLDTSAVGRRGINANAVAAMEEAILQAPLLESVVLRYGHLYGPGTGRSERPMLMPLHVDGAAYAALLAVESKVTGIFNIAEPNQGVATGQARTALHWSSDFRSYSPAYNRARAMEKRHKAYLD